MTLFFGSKDVPCDKIDGDALDLKRYATALAHFIRYCDTPMTIAVQGEWGSGKTSLMKMIAGELRKTIPGVAPIHVVDFEAWQYGAIKEDEALGLLFLAHLTKKVFEKGNRNDANFRDQARAIANFALGVARVMGVAAKAATAAAITKYSAGVLDGPTLVSGAPDGTPAAAAGARATIDSLAELKDQFTKFVEEALKPVSGQKGKATPEGRFVIFIDDLDRVPPGSAITLLETLKNFADVPHCVFVVACDYEVVRQGVRQRLGIESDEKKEEAFFHKIFQLPFTMPTEQYKIDRLLEQFFQSKLGPSNSTTARSIATQVQNIVAIAAGTNPRSIKRFLNMLDLLSCLRYADGAQKSTASSADGEFWRDHKTVTALAWLVALQVRWPVLASGLATAASKEDTLADKSFERILDQIANGNIDELEQELVGRIDEVLRADPEEIETLGEFGTHFRGLLNDNKVLLADTRQWAKGLALGALRTRDGGPSGREEFERHVLRHRRGSDVLLAIEDLQKSARSWKYVEVVRTGRFRSQALVDGSRRTIVTIDDRLMLGISVTRKNAEEWGGAALAKATETFRKRLSEAGIDVAQIDGRAQIDLSAESVSHERFESIWKALFDYHSNINKVLADKVGRAAAKAGAGVAQGASGAAVPNGS